LQLGGQELGIDKLSLVVIGKDCTTDKTLGITPSSVREDPLHDHHRPDQQEGAEDHSKEDGIGGEQYHYVHWSSEIRK
jgi:hypothetical protein